MGLATQMIFIILIGAYAGTKADQYFQTSHPYFTAALSLLAVGLSLWYVFTDLLIRK